MPIDMIKTNDLFEKGGKQWSYMRSGSGDTWHDGVNRNKSTFSYSKKAEPKRDEGGDVVNTVMGDAEVSFKINSMDTNVALEQFITQETENNVFHVFASAGANSRTMQRVRYFGLARISPQYDESNPGREVELTIYPLANNTTSAIYPPSLPTWVSGTGVTTSSFAQNPNTYYSICAVTGSYTL